MTEPRPEPVDWPATGAAIAARWEHGHDELTDGCALCHAEFADAMTAAQIERTAPMTPADEIRAAQQRLRNARAALGNQDGAWAADHHTEGTIVHPAGSTHSLFRIHADAFRAAGTPCVSPAVGTWMALMGPPVGPAIDELLDGVAWKAEHKPSSFGSPHDNAALALARAINHTQES